MFVPASLDDLRSPGAIGREIEGRSGGRADLRGTFVGLIGFRTALIQTANGLVYHPTAFGVDFIVV